MNAMQRQSAMRNMPADALRESIKRFRHILQMGGADANLMEKCRMTIMEARIELSRRGMSAFEGTFDDA